MPLVVRFDWSQMKIWLTSREKLLLNPSEQRKALVEGIEQISNIICRYTVVEKTYCNQIDNRPSTLSKTSSRSSDIGAHIWTHITKLYSKILQYEAQVVCYFVRPKVFQYGRDIIKVDDWTVLLADIKKIDNECKDVYSVIGSNSLHKGLDDQKKQMESLYVDLLGSLDGLQDTAEGILQDGKDKNKVQEGWRWEDEKSECLQNFYTSEYETFKARIEDRVPNTCQWLLCNEKYRKWLETSTSDLLWVTADPGCGKSVLSKSLVDNELRAVPSCTTCYFFFKDDNVDQKDIANAVSALLHQILRLCTSSAVHKKAIEVFKPLGTGMSKNFHVLWALLLDIGKMLEAGSIICVLDALDECESADRGTFIDCVNKLYSKAEVERGQLEFFVTSRPYIDIETRFQDSTIRLAGEDETESIQQEIDLVIKARIPQIARQLRLNPQMQELLLNRLLETENRTYLWLRLVLEDISNRSLEVRTPKMMRTVLDAMPASIDEAYEKILGSSSKPPMTRKLLHIILAAERPLTLSEMNLALNIEEGHSSFKDVDLIPEDVFPTYIKNICGLFVTIYDSKVYLLHQTAKEFLVPPNSLAGLSEGSKTYPMQCKHSFQLKDCHHEIARICMTYLWFDEFKHIPPGSDKCYKHYCKAVRAMEDLQIEPHGGSQSTIRAFEHPEAESDVQTQERPKEYESDKIPTERSSKSTRENISKKILLPDGSWDSGICRNDLSTMKRIYKFLDYASRNWMVHFRNAEESEPKL